MTDTRPWLRLRFRANEADYRPVTWPPPGPYWCTGYGDGYATVVAYVRDGDDVTVWWPEASHVTGGPDPDGPTFTDRFPRPDWWAALAGDTDAG